MPDHQWKGFNPSAPEFVPRTHPGLASEDALIRRTMDEKSWTSSGDLTSFETGHAVNSVAFRQVGHDASTHALRRSAVFNSVVRPVLEKRGIAIPTSVSRGLRMEQKGDFSQSTNGRVSQALLRSEVFNTAVQPVLRKRGIEVAIGGSQASENSQGVHPEGNIDGTSIQKQIRAECFNSVVRPVLEKRGILAEKNVK